MNTIKAAYCILITNQERPPLRRFSPYLCRRGSSRWGSTDGRSCHTDILRRAAPWSGHGRTYKPQRCRMSGTVCHKLPKTERKVDTKVSADMREGKIDITPAAPNAEWIYLWPTFKCDFTVPSVLWFFILFYFTYFPFVLIFLLWKFHILYNFKLAFFSPHGF